MCYEYWGLFWHVARTEPPLHELNKNYHKPGFGGSWHSIDQRRDELRRVSEVACEVSAQFGEEWLQAVTGPIDPADIQMLHRCSNHVRLTLPRR